MTTQNATRTSSPWWLKILILFLGATVIWVGLIQLSKLMFGAEYTYASHAFLAGATFVLVIALLVTIVRWEGSSAKRYGLLPNRFVMGNFGIGALGYLLPSAVAAAIILSLGVATVAITGSPMEVGGQFLAVLALVLLFEAIPEELIFRGYIFATLRERYPLWVAILGQAVLFTLFGFAIGAARTPDRLLIFLFFSLSFGIIRAATGSVFATMGFHAAFQVATQPVLFSQWSAVTLIDPEGWFSDIAYGLSPLLLGPIVVIIIVKFVKGTPSAPDPADNDR